MWNKRRIFESCAICVSIVLFALVVLELIFG